MRCRYLGPSRACVGGAIAEGDVVESSHPLFVHDPRLWQRLMECGALVPMEPEAAMFTPPENAMAARPRARKGGRP